MQLVRQFLDSPSTIIYLLDDEGDGRRYQSYLLDSLIAEREFLLAVRRQVAERGGQRLPIEGPGPCGWGRGATDPAGPISAKYLSRMLRDRDYLGFIDYNGEEFPRRHEPLVTAELFAKVQSVLDERLPKRARGSGGITTT
jgi:hypothetical protein